MSRLWAVAGFVLTCSVDKSRSQCGFKPCWYQLCLGSVAGDILVDIQRSDTSFSGYCPDLQVTNETLVAIFQTILTWHLSSGAFPQGCQQLGPGIIAATLEMYSQSIAKLLPTPTKSHYTFNLRDFARVIQVRVHHHLRAGTVCRTGPLPCLPEAAAPLMLSCLTKQYCPVCLNDHRKQHCEAASRLKRALDKGQEVRLL